ncbi:hypothetical protein, partial [Streptococcus pneumoniae]|uniref:hypothetical protein n=1 Tax=Streptococcus pneumoniae TaxID=1313 RepID=UPI0018B0659A
EGTAKADLQDSISKNKDSMTEAVKNIALPKKTETDQLDKDVLDVQTGFDTNNIPAGTGEDRFETEGQ